MSKTLQEAIIGRAVQLLRGMPEIATRAIGQAIKSTGFPSGRPGSARSGRSGVPRMT